MAWTRPPAKQALSGAAKGFSAFLYVNPIELAKGVTRRHEPAGGDARRGEGRHGRIALSVATDAGSLRVLLDVPLETVKQGFAAFEKTKGSF
ncbi:MAG: hypothetical protein R3F43_11300 [bacterium]